jgi:hypothetical protein
MSGQDIHLSKVVESIATRQWYGLRNKLSRLDDKKVKYNRFHSQFGEDRYIYNNIDLPEKGIFVDVGAGHPIYLSNTYFFEKNGWTGVCIDADPKQYEHLKKNELMSNGQLLLLKKGKSNFLKLIPQLIRVPSRKKRIRD